MPEDIGTGNEAVGNEGGDSQNESQLDPGLFPGLENVPQDLRQQVDPILREMQANANSRIEKVNSELEAYKPYAELNFQEKVDPETMAGLIGLSEALQAAEQGDKEAFGNWWNTIGNEFELFPDGGEEEEFELGEEENNQFTPDQIKEAIQAGIQEYMTPFQQQQQQAAEAAEVEQANQNIDQELEPIKQELGDNFSEDVEKQILKLGLGHNENQITNGYKEWKQIVEGAQGDLFSNVENQPPPGEGPGPANTNAERITSFGDAEKFARDYLRKQTAANQQ